MEGEEEGSSWLYRPKLSASVFKKSSSCRESSRIVSSSPGPKLDSSSSFQPRSTTPLTTSSSAPPSLPPPPPPPPAGSETKSSNTSKNSRPAIKNLECTNSSFSFSFYPDGLSSKFSDSNPPPTPCIMPKPGLDACSPSQQGRPRVKSDKTSDLDNPPLHRATPHVQHDLQEVGTADYKSAGPAHNKYQETTKTSSGLDNPVRESRSANAGPPKSKQRSLSPMPSTILSAVFREAKARGRRFPPPPRSRKESRHGLTADHRDSSPVRHLSSMKAAAGKHKARGGRVAAVEDAEEQRTIDLSKLYIGLRFASGAQSRLYHGLYKDQPVAVKIVRQPEDDDDDKGVMAARLERQFNREVTFLSRLSHRNVIKLEGACKTPPIFCIITEYLSGGSLRAFLHKLEHKSVPLKEMISIGLQIARGLEYIHSQGIIHRDIKPENILFDKDSCVKIADFGTACEEARCDVLANDPGTYRWMAPEMLKHKAYGRKVDVYSFGLILWEMVAGTIPYEDMSPIQAAFAVVNKNLRPKIPAGCPSAVQALIQLCWALHPEKRPEFYQIVKVIEQFESMLAREGTLDQLQNLTSFLDHKKGLHNWIQKLKPLHADVSVRPIPKLL